MLWLVYTRGLRAPSPRLIHDVDGAGNPILGEAERGDGVVLAKHRLKLDEERLGIDALVKRYRPPGSPDDRAPVQPDPDPPAPTGGAAAKQLEAA